MAKNVLCRDGENLMRHDDEHGLVEIAWTCPSRLKLVMTHKPQTPLYYDVPNDGTLTLMPLPYGNGEYRLDLVRKTYDSWATVKDLTFHDSGRRAPSAFVGRTAWCAYASGGPCERLALKLSNPPCDDEEYVTRVKDWIRKNLKYDNDKAKVLTGGHGYVPNPDKTVADGTGICSDVASAMVALLRIRGIKTRLVTGYLKPEMRSHAWVEYISLDGEKGSFVRYDPSMLLRTKRAKLVEHSYQTVCIW